MKEYRIVCTLDKEDAFDGTKRHYDAVPCTWNGASHQLVTRDILSAAKFLIMARRECEYFDKETKKNISRNTIIYTQTNIRVQTRNVTEWEDE